MGTLIPTLPESMAGSLITEPSQPIDFSKQKLLGFCLFGIDDSINLLWRINVLEYLSIACFIWSFISLAFSVYKGVQDENIGYLLLNNELPPNSGTHSTNTLLSSQVPGWSISQGSL